MIAAVLVLYSPEYCERSLAILRRILLRVDEEVRIIAVCNRPGLPVSPDPDVEVIEGNNFLHEFGGWDQGIAHFRQMAGKKSPGLFVFANDTFCHHRPFSRPDGYLFSACFKHASGKQYAIAGERSTFGQEFFLGGQWMDSWVSTYLYAITPSLLEALDWRTALDEQTLRHFVLGGTDENAFFSPDMNPALARHLSGWLFAGHDGKRNWRNAAPLDPHNADRMYHKARAIMCEKFLSARCRSLGAEFLDPYESAQGRALRAYRRYQGSLGVWRR